MITSLETPQKYKSLSRRMIVKLYEDIKTEDKRSKFYIVKKICQELEYVVDCNGSNSFVLKVLREHDHRIWQ